MNAKTYDDDDDEWSCDDWCGKQDLACGAAAYEKSEHSCGLNQFRPLQCSTKKETTRKVCTCVVPEPPDCTTSCCPLSWDNVEVPCGAPEECMAVIKTDDRFSYYQTCSNFCREQQDRLECVASYDDDGDECPDEWKDKGCNYDFKDKTSDAVCKCKMPSTSTTATKTTATFTSTSTTTNTNTTTTTTTATATTSTATVTTSTTTASTTATATTNTNTVTNAATAGRDTKGNTSSAAPAAGNDSARSTDHSSDAHGDTKGNSSSAAPAAGNDTASSTDHSSGSGGKAAGAVIGILLLAVACGLVAWHFDVLPHISFGVPAPMPPPRNFSASMGTLSKSKPLNGMIDEQQQYSFGDNDDGTLYLAPTAVDDPAYVDLSGEDSFDGTLYLEPTPVEDPAYANPSGVESFDGFPENVDDGSNFYVEPNQSDSNRRAAAAPTEAAAAAAVVLKAKKTKRRPQATSSSAFTDEPELEFAAFTTGGSSASESAAAAVKGNAVRPVAVQTAHKSATETQCKYKSGGKATGKPCKKMADGGSGSEFCERHTCSVDVCLNSKASARARCVHCSTQAVVNNAYEYVDVTAV